MMLIVAAGAAAVELAEESEKVFMLVVPPLFVVGDAAEAFVAEIEELVILSDEVGELVELLGGSTGRPCVSMLVDGPGLLVLVVVSVNVAIVVAMTVNVGSSEDVELVSTHTPAISAHAESDGHGPVMVSLIVGRC